MNATVLEPNIKKQQVMLPEELQALAGRILDLDSHEMIPAQEWLRLFGDNLRPMVDYYLEFGETEEVDRNTVNVQGYPGDITPIDARIAEIKGARAPGAVDHSRRIEVMDALGIHRQIMYPSNPAVYAMFLYRWAANPGMLTFAKGDAAARRGAAQRIIHAHNEELTGAARISDRLRPAPLLIGDTPRELIRRAQEFLKKGIRALWLFPSGELPGGVSPAHTDLDPLYAMLAEANCALLLHIAGEGNFLASEAWDRAPAFAGHIRHVEFSRSPWFTAKMHLEVENFTTVMVMGGVFDRHPRLRFGVIETAAYWIGPLARRLDLWYRLDKGIINLPRQGQVRPYRLPEMPSFYINRNVRVTPFWFEDFATDLQNYNVPDTMCFSTDYPHVEGGKNPVRLHYDKIKHLGAATLEKYFVTNAAWLLPD
jgi:predicted TIM-barrel fold metal-dependent hydrolase